MANFNLEEYIKDLSPELQEKAKECKSVKELLSLADENNVELPTDVLATVFGGTAFTAGTPEFNYHINHPDSCFYCRIKAKRTGKTQKSSTPCSDEIDIQYRCEKCGRTWWR